jgi:hypothetical protein
MIDLELFIQKYRNALDTAAPDVHGWQGVERALERLKTADNLEKAILFDRILLDQATPTATIWAGIERTLDVKDCNEPADIECFIRNHRQAFDVEMPGEHLWAAIEADIPAAGKRVERSPMRVRFNAWSGTLMRIAAAITLLVTGAGMGIWYSQQSAGYNAMAMSDVSAEYAELEQYYQREITTKQQQLATFAGYHPTEVSDDLQQMDHIMAELQQELANVPPGNREQVVRAMIENYEAKASVLQRVLEQLTKTDPSQSEGTNKQQYEHF